MLHLHLDLIVAWVQNTTLLPGIEKDVDLWMALLCVCKYAGTISSSLE